MSVSEERNTPWSPLALVAAKVKAGAAIYAGSRLVNSGGYVTPATKAENLVTVGVAQDSVPSVASNGDAEVMVRLEKAGPAFKFENASGSGAIAQAQCWGDAYIEDAVTVTKTAAGSSKAGRIVKVEADGIWVMP